MDNLMVVVIGPRNSGKITLIRKVFHEFHSVSEGVAERTEKPCENVSQPNGIDNRELEERSKGIIVDDANVEVKKSLKNF